MESPGALPSWAWFSSWYVVSIDTGHIAQSPQSGPRWSPAFKIEPVLFSPSIVGYHNQEVDIDTIHRTHSCFSIYNALICVCVHACVCVYVCVCVWLNSFSHVWLLPPWSWCLTVTLPQDAFLLPLC